MQVAFKLKIVQDEPNAKGTKEGEQKQWNCKRVLMREKAPQKMRWVTEMVNFYFEQEAVVLKIWLNLPAPFRWKMWEDR